MVVRHRIMNNYLLINCFFNLQKAVDDFRLRIAAENMTLVSAEIISETPYLQVESLKVLTVFTFDLGFMPRHYHVVWEMFIGRKVYG